MNDLAFSNPVHTRMLSTTAEQIIEHRLRTAPASSQISTKLIRNPKYYLYFDVRHVFLFAYPSSDEGKVKKRISLHGTPVPSLFSLREKNSPPVAITISPSSYPHLIAGEINGTNGKATFALPDMPGSIFGLEADSELGLTNLSVRVQRNGLEYDVPFFISIVFGVKLRIGNAAEALDTIASLMMSRSSPKPQLAVR